MREIREMRKRWEEEMRERRDDGWQGDDTCANGKPRKSDGGLRGEDKRCEEVQR